MKGGRRVGKNEGGILPYIRTFIPSPLRGTDLLQKFWEFFFEILKIED